MPIDSKIQELAAADPANAMSTEAKHTPGPWHVDTSYSESGVVTSLGIHSSGGAVPATFANAYLMAAAPEMLEALQRILPAAIAREEPDSYDQDGDIAFAEAAIAKAKGETP